MVDKENNKDDKAEKHTGFDMLNSTGLVVSLGVVIIILGIMRIAGINVSASFLLGVSTLSLSLIIIEALRLEGKKNIFFQVVGFFILICFPNIYFIQNMNEEVILRVSDGISLAAMGTTLILIGKKALREFIGMLESNSNIMMYMAEGMSDASEKYKKLAEEHIELRRQLNEIKKESNSNN